MKKIYMILKLIFNVFHWICGYSEFTLHLALVSFDSFYLSFLTLELIVIWFLLKLLVFTKKTNISEFLELVPTFITWISAMLDFWFSFASDCYLNKTWVIIPHFNLDYSCSSFKMLSWTSKWLSKWNHD